MEQRPTYRAGFALDITLCGKGEHMRILTLAVSLLLISGCTNFYKPVSTWEQSVFDQSRFDVYPDDVRKNFDSFKDARLAWAGTIDKVAIDRSVQPVLMHLVISHHYFTWHIDGTTRKYWLSPRGEGKFKTSWSMRPEWDLDEMLKLIRQGDMVIVYGVPKRIEVNSDIDFGQASYIRQVPPAGFRTDVIDYGRPGEPTKVLSVF